MKLILINQETFDRVNGYTQDGDVIAPRELSKEAQKKYGFKYAVSMNSFIKHKEQSIKLIEYGNNFISVDGDPSLFPLEENNF